MRKTSPGLGLWEPSKTRKSARSHTYMTADGEFFVCAEHLNDLFHIPKKATRIWLRVGTEEFEESVPVYVRTTAEIFWEDATRFDSKSRVVHTTRWGLTIMEDDIAYEAMTIWFIKNFGAYDHKLKYWVGVFYVEE